MFFKKKSNLITYSITFSLLIFIAFCKTSYAAEGLSFNKDHLKNKDLSDYLNPGKVDLLYKHKKASDTFNTIWWSPILKGGAGYIDYKNGNETKYIGGYVRPLLTKENKGELILGGLEVDSATGVDYEFQGEYRFPFGLGLGGGFVSKDNSLADIEFGKISFRDKIDLWNYIITAQYQEIGKEESAGGYLAIYDDVWMLASGSDGEQWRATLGFIAPDNNSFLRPAFETLYVDNTIGNIAGIEFLFINATLRYKGGFLCHPARLGRAMGPTGIEYGNPLGFLAPTWNRRLDVWELGQLADFRLDRIKSSTGVVTARYETVIFPSQFDENDNFLDNFYMGGFYLQNSSSRDSHGILGGVLAKLSFLQVAVGADYDFETSEKRITVGIIDKF